VRHSKLKKVLFGTAASLGTAMLVPIQDAAHAQQTAAEAILEEVVVTARRREESLEDAPLSVVAISGAALQAQGIYNTRQIGDFAANVNLQVEDRNNISQIHIRGIGGGFANPIQVFGSGMYMDGHYLAGSIGNYMSTMDVERVEVLRGPQGTLFGKNLTGGAINIISTKPHEEFEGEAVVRAGDYGQKDVRGMINVPLAENVFGRFSFADESNDGFWTNRIKGQSVDWTDEQSFRGALRFTPGNWTIDATYLHTEQQGGQTGLRCNARPTQGLLDNLANLNPGDPLEGELPGQDPAVLANHPAQDVSGIPTFDGSGQAAGYGAWGGATTYPDGTTANVGGHIEQLGAGETVRYIRNCMADAAAGDFVNSAEGADTSEAESDNFFITAVWDAEGPIGGMEALQVRTSMTRRDSGYRFESDRDHGIVSGDNLSHVGFGPGFNQESTGFEMIFDATVNDRLSFLAGVYWFDDQASTGSGDCWPLFAAPGGVRDNVFAAINQFSDPATEQPDGTAVSLNPAFRAEGEAIVGDTPCGPSTGGSGLNFQFLPLDLRIAAGTVSPLDLDTYGFGPGPHGAFQQVNTYTESKAIFGHVNYAINDDWSMEVGARWTEDHRWFNIVEFSAQSTCDFRGLGSHCAPMPSMNYSSLMDFGFFGEGDATFDEITPMVSLTRNLEGGDTLDSGIVYFLISEGFLTGSFNDELNTVRFPDLEQLRGYGPEFVTNYEVGFKGSFAGGRVRLNADVFWMDYQDKQEAINIDNPDGLYGPDPTVEITQNAATVDIYGIEVELRASPWDGGFLTFDLGWFENEYSQFQTIDPTDPNGALLDLSGFRIFDRQPDWTINASIGHTFQLANGAALTPQLGMYMQGEYEWEPNTLLTDTTPCFQDSYERFRARVTYAPAEGNWEASLFGENIGDERYYTFCEAGRSGANIAAYGRPDWWGLEFVARFGGN